MHVPRPERGLVVGCGDGEPLLFLAREFPTARVRGVDGSTEAVRAAQARIGLDPEGRVAVKPSGRRLPYPDAHFDLVAVVDERPRCGELARVLRPAGHLVLVRSRPAGRLGSIRARLGHRCLASRGFEVERDEPAGDGNFLVARLGAGSSRASGE
jgi:SAM-dependent methyltransferase